MEGFLALVGLILIVWVRHLSQRIRLIEESSIDSRADVHQLTALTRRVTELETALNRQRVQPPAAPPIPAPVPAPIPAPMPAPMPPPAPPPVAAPILREPPKWKPVDVPVVVPQPPPPPPVRETAEPASATPPAPPAKWINWESLVGVKLFSAIAGIALITAAVFFLKFSIDNGWLQPPVRAAIGVIVSIALLIACELKAARKYPATANAMDAAAIAILFATTFASHALWHLIPGSAAFGLLALVTSVAVLLSIRRSSMFIAVLGLLGGFATPILLSTGENRPVSLFTYLLLLNVGLAWVAQRKRWPALTWLSFAFTALYQWGWVLKFLDVRTLPLAMGIFLLFPIVALGTLRLRHSESGDGASEQFRQAARYSAFMPAAFGIYLTSGPFYGADPLVLFGFVLLIDTGLLAVALGMRDERLHLAGAVTTMLTLASWLLRPNFAAANWAPALEFTAAFVLFYVFAPAIARAVRRPFSGVGSTATFAAPLLLATTVALAFLESPGRHPWALFGTLLGLLIVIGWRAVVSRQGALYHVAAIVAVAAQAVWSVMHLTNDTLREAVLIYSVFGLVALAVPVIARRTRRPLEPVWGSGAALLCSLTLLFFISLGFTTPAALWALALLLAIMNAALFIESAGGRLPIVSLAGSLLSWIILGTWWSHSAATIGLIPSLTVLTGLSLVTLAGHAWSTRATANDTAPTESVGDGLFLGLIGQLFLMWLAHDPQWASAPAPLFGALAIITLATSAAALYGRRPSLHAAGAIAAGVVILVWSQAAATPGSGVIAIAAAILVSIYAIVWTAMTRWPAAMIAAATTVTLGVLTTVTTVLSGGQPPFAAVVSAQAAFAITQLAIAWRSRWRWLAIVAAAAAWLAVSPWEAYVRSWSPANELLIIVGALYLIFVAYPIVLGAKAADVREPFIAAVIASLMFVVISHDAFLRAGLGWMVGVVPIVAGASLALLLRQLLRLQPSGARDNGRLALVAGAALACVTVAIPMQLDRQWITIGWALEGAALAWLHLRIPHRGLLYGSMALLAVVAARLSLDPEILVHQSLGAARIFNWYLYTYLLSAAAMFAAGRWFAQRDEALTPQFRPSRWMPAAGVVLLFFLLNIEIADFYATGPIVSFQFGVSLAQDLTYTIGWLVFGMALLAAGIIAPNRAARITAVALIAVTTFKCFLYDLSSLGGLYRVASFVGLAVSLSLVALALQKFVIAKPQAAS